MYLIKEILAIETYPVRHSVLRKGKTIAACIFDDDDLPTTIHYGCFKKEMLVGVASLYQKVNPNFDAVAQFQLRGMAVVDEFQKKGIGEQLLIFVEKKMKELQNEVVVWCRARESAVGFYKKQNYSLIGNVFDIEGIGNHYVMYKKITHP